MNGRDDTPFEVRYDSALDTQGWTLAYHAMTRDLRISDGAYRLYLLLHQYAQQRGEAWPSRKTLAQGIGVSEPTIKRRLQELINIGLIERRRKRFGGVFTTYILNPNGRYQQGLVSAIGVKNDPYGDSIGVKNDPSYGSNLTRHGNYLPSRE